MLFNKMNISENAHQSVSLLLSLKQIALEQSIFDLIIHKKYKDTKWT